jgi:hypothetical protein
MHNKKDNNSKNQKFIQGLRPFSSFIPHGLKKIFKKSGYNLSNVVDNWTKMVGPDISKACYPSTVKVGKDMSDGTLILNVIHGKELEIEYSKSKIIDEINGFFGYNYIKEIKLKVVQEKKYLIKESLIPDKNMDQYNKKINAIKSDDLKNSLVKLIKAYKNKND